MYHNVNTIMAKKLGTLCTKHTVIRQVLQICFRLFVEDFEILLSAKKLKTFFKYIITSDSLYTGCIYAPIKRDNDISVAQKGKYSHI